MFPRLSIPRLQFSLLALLFFIVLVGSSFGMWWRWAPWAIEVQLPLPDTEVLGRKDVFSPDGRFVAAFLPHETMGAVTDGKLIATGSPRDRTILWNTDTGQMYGILLGGKRDTMYPALFRFTPDSQWILHQTHEAGHWTLAAWRIAPQLRPAPTLTFRSKGICLRYLPLVSPDGRAILQVEGKRLVYRVGNRSIPVLDDAPDSGLDTCNGAIFSSDGRWLAICRFPNTELYDILNTVTPMDMAGSEVAFCPDNSLVLMGGENSCTLHSLPGGRTLCHLAGSMPEGEYYRCSPCPISHDGKRVVTIDKEQRKANIYDTSNGKQTHRFDLPVDGGINGSYGVMFSPDGKRLLCRSILHCSLFDLVSGNTLFIGPRWGTFSRDGSRVICSEEKREALIVDANDGQRLFRMSMRDHEVSSVDFSKDGRALTSDHKSIAIWSLRRPEYWWGIAWLPEFWIALLSGGALLFIAARNIRRRFAKPPAEPTQQPVADSQ